METNLCVVLVCVLTGDVKINFTLTPLKVSLTLAVTHLVVNEVFETITTHSCLTFYNVDEPSSSGDCIHLI